MVTSVAKTAFENAVFNFIAAADFFFLSSELLSLHDSVSLVAALFANSVGFYPKYFL